MRSSRYPGDDPLLWREEETRRTTREWNQRMTRLNSIDLGTAEPKVSPAYAAGGPGYAGLYQYMSTNVMVGAGGTEVRGRQVQPTNFERWVSRKGQQGSSSTAGRNRDQPEQLTPNNITPAQCKEIQRSFQRADITRDGYLDCEELKTFMELRGSPLTHWDAKKLLHSIDTKYGAYINLDQIMFLVFHCGIMTEHERPMCAAQFQNVLKRLQSSSSSRDENQRPQYESPAPARLHPDILPRKSQIVEDRIPMDGARSYFEDMASELEAKATQEFLYQKYRAEVRSGVRNQADSITAEPPRKPSGPPGWENMVLHSQEPPEPTPDFRLLKGKWEEQVKRTREEELERERNQSRSRTREEELERAKNQSRSRTREEELEREKNQSAAPPSSIDNVTFPPPPSLSPALCRKEVQLQNMSAKLGRVFERRQAETGPTVPGGCLLAMTVGALQAPPPDENNSEPAKYGPLVLYTPPAGGLKVPAAPLAQPEPNLRTDVLFKKESKLSQVSHLQID